MRRVYVALGLSCALVAASCGSQTPPPQPASFDRPGRVAFVCFETDGDEGPRPVPLERCEAADGDEGDGEPNLAMHALVTQTSRGEIAAVDLEKRRILDSRKDVPGYTFLPVGELPSAVVVPRAHPEHTYVANFGSRTITVLRTRAFRGLSVGESATVQTVAVRVPGTTMHAGPVDMVLSPEEDALLLALPDANALVRLPIRRCTEGKSDEDAGTTGDAGAAACVAGTLDEAAATAIPLDLSLPQAVTSAAPAAVQEPYLKACDDSVLLPAQPGVATTIPADAFARKPEPVALALDAFCKSGVPCKRRLLVADRSLPILHAVDLDLLAAGDEDGSVLAPIVTGVPTTAVAVTPRVPKNLEDDELETQYVYAVDANDGSLLVTENGVVLSVGTDPTKPANRVVLGGASRTSAPLRAISLAVVSPQFDVTGDAAQYVSADPVVIVVPEGGAPDSGLPEGGLPTTDPDGLTCTDDDFTQRDASRLRGVFLAVGGSDGSVRIVDVHDMELRACRTCDPQLVDPYPVIRHRTRIRATLPNDADESPRIVPEVTPTATVSGRTVLINVDGTTPNPNVDGLSCVPCAPPLVDAYPDPQDLVDLADAGLSLDAAVDAATTDAQTADLDASVSDAGVDAGADASIDGGVEDDDPTRPGIGRRCAQGSARVCALADPWAALESWSAVFEGRIPGAHGGHGRFVPPESTDNRSGKLELASEVAFCATGVQGNDDLPDGAMHVGDQLVITSELPPTTVLPSGDLRDDCEILVKARKKGDFPIALPILQAWDDRLVLGTKLLVPSRDLKLPARRGADGRLAARTLDYELVAACFAEMLMTFEVHTRDAYTVLGHSGTGFSHRIVRGTDGRCVTDTTQSTLVNGRAYEDEPFVSTKISFQIAGPRTVSGGQGRTRPGTLIQFALRSATPKMFLDATAGRFGTVPGTQPIDLRYNDVDQRLYMIDMASRGLLPIPLDGFPQQLGSSFE